jgi:amino acid transporter
MGKQVESELSRELSLFHITMMGVGMMIGAGVFVTTGIGIGMAGPGGILTALALNGLLAFLSVMTYAELSSAIPRAGAGYSYIQESIGGFTGFLSGWISWFAHAVAGSLYAITLSQYTLHFLSQFEMFHWLHANLALYEKGFAVLMALVFIYINYRGASETGTAGAVMAIGQTVVLALIGLIGVIVAMKSPGKLANFDPFLPHGWGKIFVVMGFSLVGFEGYEVIANTAEEVVDAKKNVPKAIFYAVIIVITTYLLVAFAAIIGVQTSGQPVIEWFHDRGSTGFADAIAQLFPFGSLFVFLAVVFASTSALNATIYSSTRIAFTLGRDGYLPPFFSHISQKTRTPHIALCFSGAIIIVIAAAFPVEVVCAGASIFFIVLFNLVTVALIKIRKEQGDELEYGYLMPFFPIIPVISFVGRLLIGLFLFDMGVLAYIIAAIWVGSGVLLYVVYAKSHATRKKATEIVVYDQEGETPPQPVSDYGLGGKSLNSSCAREICQCGCQGQRR